MRVDSPPILVWARASVCAAGAIYVRDFCGSGGVGGARTRSRTSRSEWCCFGVHGLLGGMEELHLITDKGAEPSSAVKRLVGAFAGLRSSQVVRAAFGHLSLFGALVAYTALGGLVSKTLFLLRWNLFSPFTALWLWVFCFMFWLHYN